MIIESIVSTVNENGSPHIVPLGLSYQSPPGSGQLDRIVLAPFIPSTTLDNLARTGTAVINFVDDVRVFAGCLTGHFQWAVKPALQIEGNFLECALTHIEVQVETRVEDDIRPQFICVEVRRESHAPFNGFNRAQAAVIEGAILVSRLHMLDNRKIDSEIAYLSIAIEKTAGPREREAWQWLMDRIKLYRESDSEDQD